MQKNVKNFMAMPTSGSTMGALVGKPTGAETSGSNMRGFLGPDRESSTVGQYRKPGSLAAELSALAKDKNFVK